MPRMDDETKADFLEQPHIGVLATLRRNGLPYSVPVWWLHDDGEFYRKRNNCGVRRDFTFTPPAPETP